MGDIILDLGMYFVVPGGKGLSYKRFNFSSYLNPRLRRFQKRTPLIWISRPVLGFNVLVGLFIYVFIFIYPNPISRFDYVKYKKTENNTWSSLVRTCEDEYIELANIIIIHTKYPINCEHLFGFSVRTPQSNVNCGLILHDYDCIEMMLDETCPPMFTEDKWEYLLP